MIELSPTIFALAAFAVVFAGVSKAGFGSGAAFASSTILALILEPGQALGLMLPLLMLIDLASLRPYWRTWHWPEARLMLLGALPGVALGVLLYRLADADLMRLLIGAISILFVLWQVGRGRGWIRMAGRGLPGWAGALAGAITGFTSFVSHAGGPPAAVYLLSRRLSKGQYQGTTVLIFWVINIMKFIPYAVLGMFTLETAVADLALAPFALFGTWLGVRAHRVVSERVFFGLTYVLLLITGSKLIWDGLS
ncbi:MAG: sulfite exporter TauE/SafE family protein [Pseudodonghicola sp.]